MCERNCCADTKAGEEGGEEVLRCQNRDSPAALGATHGEAAVPLQPLEGHNGAGIHLQPMDDPIPEQGDV